MSVPVFAKLSPDAMRHATLSLLLVSLAASGCSGSVPSPSAEPGTTAGTFDGARWISSLPRSSAEMDLAARPLAELSAASPEIAECLAGEPDPGMHEAAGARAMRMPSGSVLVRVECPFGYGTGAYGGFITVAVVSDQGIRVTDFMNVDEETHAVVQEGSIAHGLDSFDRAGEGIVDILYKSGGAGGCGRFVTYRMAADGRSLVAETIREQACNSGPPDFEALPDSVMLNSTCDGEPCYDPNLWGIVWRRDG